MTTRTQVAEYLADQLTSGRSSAVQQAAAWLVSRGRARQARYLARDVAAALVERGYVYARVTTARPLSAGARTAVETFIKRETGARQLELEVQINPLALGGLRLEVPAAELDATIQHRLATLVEGVQA